MLKYRTEIDGLRTIAIIPVILFHLGYGFVKGGYMGVDIFFVISGYLMTKILTEEIGKGNFSMYRFWLRRIKRILPLLLTIILVTILIVPFIVFKPVVKEVSRDVFPAVFSYFNFHALYDFGNYWGIKSEHSFFLHTWSLSVEEQFYLLYPIFLSVAYKYFKNIVVAILAITIVSFCLFFFFLKINKEVDVAFYMLPTRIWEFTFGGLAGLIHIDKIKTSFKTTFLPLVGICLIIYAFLFGSQFLGYSVLLPVAGAGLIILFCTPNDIIGSILSSKIFVLLGKLSYSLYLWHWVIIVLFKYCSFQLDYINQHILNGLILFFTFCLSYLTYTFIENKTRNFQHTPKIVLAAIVAIAGLSLYFQSDYFSPYYRSKYNQQTSYIEYFDISPSQNALQAYLEKDKLNYNTIIPERSDKFNDAYKKEGIIINKINGTPKIILIGDSHGVMWAKILNEISDECNVSISCYTSNGSKPFFNLEDVNSQTKNEIYTKTQRTEYVQSFLDNIEKWKPKLIVLACRWDLYYDVNYLNSLLSYLEKRKIRILLFTQPPVLDFMENKNASQYFTYLNLHPVKGFNLIDVNNSIVLKNNNYIKSMASKYANVFVYDVYNNMTENAKVKISLDKEVLYFDDDHLSYYGTFLHKDHISSLITRMVH